MRERQNAICDLLIMRDFVACDKSKKRREGDIIRYVTRDLSCVVRIVKIKINKWSNHDRVLHRASVSRENKLKSN